MPGYAESDTRFCRDIGHDVYAAPQLGSVLV